MLTNVNKMWERFFFFVFLSGFLMVYRRIKKKLNSQIMSKLSYKIFFKDGNLK